MQILRACNPHKFSNIRIVMVDEVLLVENKFYGRPVNSYGNFAAFIQFIKFAIILLMHID